MLRSFFLKYDRQIQRLLEILPGTVSWGLIVFFFAGSFLIPLYIAYLVIFFDIFWFYKSITFAFSTTLSYLRIKASEKMDWLGEVRLFPDWKKIRHIVIIPQYKEPTHILERTIQSLVNQDFPLKQISVVMATEARDPNGAKIAGTLGKKYGKKFADFFITSHKLAPGETIGKHSNENYAARWVKKELVDKQKIKIDYLTVTSSDADHCFHPKHFSCLSYRFLDSPERYLRFWQPAVFFYNNFWRLPAIVRVINTFNTLWNGAVLSRKDRLISCQNYSLSLKLLDETGYWDPKVIPEDYHLFFKAYYKKEGKVEVEPIFLPLYADAAEGATLWKTLKNTYQQSQRWAWGISDDPNVIKNYFLTPTAPFPDKTIRLLRLMEDHILAPVNWFFITLGITIPTLFVRDFSRTIIGYSLPRISAIILNLCLIFLVVILIVNAKQRPPRPQTVSRLRSLLIPLEFVLMPLSGLIFGVIPGLDAHTRLMLGKYLEYKVTEKV
ncbi:glycosyltransferase family 2 protein [Candidatus Shapirobacteria bacterium]|nr:glycosyltransferase family 2 protein [Candidatus Shapirobacteria bacterium]